jgi:DNA polymerase III delta prime subunit
MMTLENRHRPRRFSEYKGGGWPLDLIKSLVANNRHSSQGGLNPYRVGNILLYGASSCGKTTLAMLYARATLCPNREVGQYEPCGTCEVCTGVDVTNIYHHTIVNPTESHPILEGFIKRATCFPTYTTERVDQQRQFFIIDEFELATPSLASRLLESLEFSPDTTTWILCSMDIEKLRSNPQVYEAITSRCVEVPLQPPSPELIAAELVEKEGVEQEAALAIAQLTGGNFRRAWQVVTAISAIKPAVTVEDVYAHLSGGASKEARRTLWNVLARGNGKEVQEILASWVVDSVILANLLLGDIVDNLSEPNVQVQQLLLDLSRWYGHRHYPLVAVLLANLGTNILPRVVPPVVSDASEVIKRLRPRPRLLDDTSLGDLWL